MKATAVILWLVALALLSVGTWALFTEEALWGYPYFRVAAFTSILAAPFCMCASFLFYRARRQRAD
jgi:TRAP-type C4-dicarboxylate transport system permease small subunit